MDSNLYPVTDTITTVKKQRKGISGSTLKLIAIITMLIDHTAATILDRFLIVKGVNSLDANDIQGINDFLQKYGSLYYLDTAMRLIGRLGFPIFCFLLIEGFLHTHNVWKYALRLGIFSLISEIPFDLAIYGKAFYFNSQNVFFTLLIGLLVIYAIQTITEKADHIKWQTPLALIGVISAGCGIAYVFNSVSVYIYKFLNEYSGKFTIPEISVWFFVIFFVLVSLITYGIMIKTSSLQTANNKFSKVAVLIVGFALAELLKTDYSGFGIVTIVVMYSLRKSHFKSMLGGCITLTIMSLFEITSFFALIPAFLYNGKRGLNLKYVFYAFYPVHLFVLFLICYFMGIVQ